MCAPKFLDSSIYILINLPFYFPHLVKLHKPNLQSRQTAMDDKNIGVVTVDEPKDGSSSEEGHTTQQASESNSHRNVLEVSYPSSCCNNCNRRALFIYLHRPAIYQSRCNC